MHANEIKKNVRHLAILTKYTLHWRRGDLIVRALDSGSRGSGSSPGRRHCAVFLGKTLTVPLPTQVYKWVPANLMLRVALQWTGIPSSGGGGRNTPSRFMPQKPELSASQMGNLTRMQSLPTRLHIPCLITWKDLGQHNGRTSLKRAPTYFLLITRNSSF